MKLLRQHLQEISLVLTDMMMPVMDGQATIRALQKLNPAVKIIAFSGLSIEGETHFSTNLGASAFVPKPYTVEKLLLTVSGVLNDNAASA